MTEKNNVNVRLISKLGDIMNEKQIDEISIDVEGMSLHLAKHAFQQPVSQPMVAAATVPQVHPIIQHNQDNAHGSETLSVLEVNANVKSPMVGTVYLSPKPSAPTFVSVGDKVNEGDTLLIIEAMKVMNPITAPMSGKIEKIHVNNEQAVEFDHPLITISE